MEKVPKKYLAWELFIGAYWVWYALNTPIKKLGYSPLGWVLPLNCRLNALRGPKKCVKNTQKDCRKYEKCTEKCTKMRSRTYMFLDLHVKEKLVKMQKKMAKKIFLGSNTHFWSFWAPWGCFDGFFWAMGCHSLAPQTKRMVPLPSQFGKGWNIRKKMRKMPHFSPKKKAKKMRKVRKNAQKMRSESPWLIGRQYSFKL